MITFNPFSSRGGKPLTSLCRIEMSLPEGNYRDFCVSKLRIIKVVHYIEPTSITKLNSCPDSSNKVGGGGMPTTNNHQESLYFFAEFDCLVDILFIVAAGF